MKSALFLSLAATALVGCTATEPARTVTSSRAGATPIDQNRVINKRTYTQEEIKSTGRSGNVGEALSTLDAGVFISGGR